MRWTNAVNVSVSGGTLEKTSGCSGCPDAGAASEQQIASGDGGVQFTTSDSGSLRFVGLTSGGANHDPGGIKFALRLQGGVAEVREAGAYRSDIRFNAGDVLGVWVVGGAVQYSKNGTVFYTSGAEVRYPLVADASLYDLNATINDAMLLTASGGTAPPPSSSGPSPSPSPSPSSVEPARWTNLVNVEASGNNLRKVGGCSGCADAAATSEQQVRGEGGAMQFVVDEVNALRLVGLSSGGSGTAGEIEFAVRVQGGVAEVRENGAYRSEIRISSGDVITIGVSGGTVSYWKNDTVFHTSGLPPAFPMAAGALLFDANATVSSVQIRSGS